MGAWGSGAFDNDTAADWRYGLVDAASEGEAVQVIESALRAAVDPPAGEYLDADVGSCALAAAEVVAAAAGYGPVELPEDVTEWLAAHGGAVPAGFRMLARQAAERVAGPASELAELWTESNGPDGWSAEVRTLAERLAGPPA